MSGATSISRPQPFLVGGSLELRADIVDDGSDVDRRVEAPPSGRVSIRTSNPGDRRSSSPSEERRPNVVELATLLLVQRSRKLHEEDLGEAEHGVQGVRSE